MHATLNGVLYGSVGVSANHCNHSVAIQCPTVQVIIQHFYSVDTSHTYSYRQQFTSDGLCSVAVSVMERLPFTVMSKSSGVTVPALTK